MKKGKVLNLFENHKADQSKEEQYALQLTKFIQPFTDEFTLFEYHEDIYNFALLAWNFGNIKSVIDKNEFKRILAIAKDNNENFPLLKRMIAHKASNYKKFTDFIVGFELEEINSVITVTVSIEEEQSYMMSLMDGSLETTLEEDEFEENFINRSAISLKPLQPFIDWHNALYPDSKIDDTFLQEVNIYLINNTYYEDVEAHLKKKFDNYFQRELEGWHTNKKEWPQRRNYKMFKNWFQINISTAVLDLEKAPVRKSE
jgi:hypothetical protein